MPNNKRNRNEKMDHLKVVSTPKPTSGSLKDNSAAFKKQQQQQQKSAAKKGGAPPSPKEVAQKPIVKVAPPPVVNNHRGVMLFAGTYHSILAGLVYRETTDGEHKILLKFSVKNHIGCVNSVVQCGKYIASAGSDERIFIFNHKDHYQSINDLGTLAPASEVRVMRFPDQHFLVCGCEDGTVGVYRTRTWDCVSVLPVHQKAVLDMAIHPSGLVAVTIGADRMVALLDMQKAKLITKLKVPKVIPHTVLFNQEASHFAVGLNYEVCFYSTLEAKQVSAAKVPSPQPPYEIHSVHFLPDNATEIVGEFAAGGCLVGLENSSFMFIPRESFDIESAAEELEENDAEEELANKKKKKEKASEEDAGEEPVKKAKKAVPTCNFIQVEVETLPVPSKDAMMRDRTIKKPGVHETRIKCMQFCNNILFSSDSDGVVCAWKVSSDAKSKTLKLKQLCGTRCGGRITTLAAVPR